MFDVRLVDVGCVSFLVSITYALLSNPTTVNIIAGSITALLTLFVVSTSFKLVKWTDDLATTFNKFEGTQIRPTRRVGRNMPCPYPDAYYNACFSRQLPPGTVIPVTICDQNLVIFRPEATPENPYPAPACLDAYCTHLGAHLYYGGGKVVGNSIRCPFHGFLFGTDGRLVEAPGVDPTPTSSGFTVQTWPCVERNGLVLVWMNSRVHKGIYARERQNAANSKSGVECVKTSECKETIAAKGFDVATIEREFYEKQKNLDPSELDSKSGESTEIASHLNPTKSLSTRNAIDLSKVHGLSQPIPNNEITFDFPVFPEIDGPNAKYQYQGSTENIIYTPLLAIPENGMDYAHLPALHKEFIIPALSPYLGHYWNATGRTGEGENKHLSYLDLYTQLLVFDKIVPGKVRVNVTQIGPSCVVLKFKSFFGSVYIQETVTPIAPGEMAVRNSVFATNFLIRPLAQFFLWATWKQFTKDVYCWSSLRYNSQPKLVETDPGIPVFRRWTKQFSDQNSVTYDEAATYHFMKKNGFPEDSKFDW